MPHNELLVKLWNIGITGTLWNWFNSYLSNRSQCVSVENRLSDCLPVISGVPQGSMLGSLLFLIFINDLPSTIISQLLEFADDTKCFRQIISILDIQQLQEDLTSLFNWIINNHLSLNLSKFVFTSFHHKFNSQYIINVTGSMKTVLIAQDRKLDFFHTNAKLDECTIKFHCHSP